MKNIIFLSADQHHYSALSAYGNKYCKTPNLDKLTEQAVNFDLSYSPNPVCGPARSSWFSGLMPSENGVINNTPEGGMRKDHPTLGQWLSERSQYSNVYAGKWHIASNAHIYDIKGFDVICSGINRDGIIADASLSVACEGFIRNYQKKNPFFLTISYTQPHDICETIRANTLLLDKAPYGLNEKDLPPIPENFNYQHCNSKAFIQRGLYEIVRLWTEIDWRYYLWCYYRHVEMVDAEIGRIIQALEDTNQINNSIIIYTSDHGECMAHRSHVQKNTLFDESVRVPLFVAIPGIITSTIKNEKSLVSGLDIMPTICDYAGTEIPAFVSGRSFKPIVDAEINKTKYDDFREYLVSECLNDTGRMVRSKQYKYITFRKDVCDHLYDCIADPLEMKNLVDEPEMRSVLATHRQWLADWEKKLDKDPRVTKWFQ
jgi:arylsulfatase A-like enzyme